MPRQLHIHVQPRRTAPVSQGGLRPGYIAEGLAHAVHEVVGGAAHFFVRQAAGPHDHLGRATGEHLRGAENRVLAERT